LQNAVHEVMQQICLAGLNRAGFFDKAAFYGGTCLRIFYDLPRFSQDMDFSLTEIDESFNLETYFDTITNEFTLLGREVQIPNRICIFERQHRHCKYQVSNRTFHKN